MENSQPLATESFSYSWLVDRKPPFLDGLIDNVRPAFPQDTGNKDQAFNFDVPVTASPAALVHADEIFSHGHLMPVYVDRSKVEALNASTSVPASPLAPHPSRSSFAANRSHHCMLGKWRNSSKRILKKWFGFVKPLCKTIGRSRKSNRVDDLERMVSEVQSWNSSPEASRRPSSAYSVVEWADVMKIGNDADLCSGPRRHNPWRSSPRALPNISPSRSSNVWYDAENSIHEAILHCKRSIGMLQDTPLGIQTVY